MPVGAAVGVAAGGIAGSAISASKNSKAIGRATDAQTQANREAIAAQEKARSENLALQRPLYNAGLPAVGARNALLGLGGVQSTPAPQPQVNALTRFNGGPIDYGGLPNDGYNNPLARDSFPFTSSTGFDPSFIRDIAFNGSFGQNPFSGSEFRGSFGTQAAPANDVTTQQAQEDAFKAFRDSTGYRFRVNEGQDALNSGFAASGTLQSGAALKALEDYRQGVASSEFGNYWNMLGEQQNLATGAANAMSGVNTTYANNAGNLAVANGNVLANSAIARANNTNGFIGGAFNALSSGVGILAGAGRL